LGINWFESELKLVAHEYGQLCGGSVESGGKKVILNFIVVINGRRRCFSVGSLIELVGKLKTEIGDDWYMIQSGNIVRSVDSVTESAIRIYGRLRGGEVKRSFKTHYGFWL
jgi:hypothetical protein